MYWDDNKVKLSATQTIENSLWKRTTDWAMAHQTANS